MQGRRRLLALPALAVLFGCSLDGLALRQDDRISITSPDDGDDVSLPMTLRWTARDVDLAGGTSFGVVVDDAVPRPGRLADDTVLRTTDTSLVLDQLGSSNRPGGQGGHEITLILLDGHGRRDGEGAWRIRVDVEDPR